MATYGIHLGTAFQLIDDVLDYSGAEVETGKHLGDDLAEGKPTLPLIFVLQQWQHRTGGLRKAGHREWRSGRLPAGPGSDSRHRGARLRETARPGRG
jgi:geranylgeranyl pyrophosphate synthase